MNSVKGSTSRAKIKFDKLGCSLKNGRFKDFSIFRNRGDLKIPQYLRTRFVNDLHESHADIRNNK